MGKKRRTEEKAMKNAEKAARKAAEKAAKKAPTWAKTRRANKPTKKKAGPLGEEAHAAPRSGVAPAPEQPPEQSSSGNYPSSRHARWARSWRA